MKVSGRKNDGAWYRANKVIQGLDSTEQGDLTALMNGMTSIGGFYEAIEAIASSGGLSLGGSGLATSVGDLADTYATKGIPRQAWFGRLSYDTYTRTGSPGAYEYEAEHQSQVHEFGKEIRKLMKKFVFSRRAAKDLSNKASRSAGNPSGVADATAGS